MQSETNFGATVTGPQAETQEHNRLKASLPEAGGEAPAVRTQVVGDKPAAVDPGVQLAEDLRGFQRVAARVHAELSPEEGFEERCQQAFNLANDLFGHAPTWVCFFREVLATKGVVNLLFPEQEEFERFQESSEYRQIEQMVTALRSREWPENDPNDPQRMITVRLPKSLHEALCHEAGRLNVSVNKLCVTRLLQRLDKTMVPLCGSKPRGRKPRTQVQAQPETAGEAALAGEGALGDEPAGRGELLGGEFLGGEAAES
jgi:predicted HicB family RNase H-like nuclease